MSLLSRLSGGRTIAIGELEPERPTPAAAGLGPLPQLAFGHGPGAIGALCDQRLQTSTGALWSLMQAHGPDTLQELQRCFVAFRDGVQAHSARTIVHISFGRVPLNVFDANAQLAIQHRLGAAAAVHLCICVLNGPVDTRAKAGTQLSLNTAGCIVRFGSLKPQSSRAAERLLTRVVLERATCFLSSREVVVPEPVPEPLAPAEKKRKMTLRDDISMKTRKAPCTPPCKRPQPHAAIREDVHRQLPPRRVLPSFRLSMKTRMAPCTPPSKRPEPHADLKRTVDELKAENQKLKLTIDELGLDELRAESDKREHTAIQELKAESTELKDENNRLKRESEKLKREIEKLKAESAELKAESTELKDDNNVLKRESEKLKGESEKLKAESAELKAENNKLERESEKPKQTNDELTQMVHKLKGEQEKSKHTIAKLNSKWFYADQENSRLKQQNKGLITQVHELVDGPGRRR